MTALRSHPATADRSRSCRPRKRAARPEPQPPPRAAEPPAWWSSRAGSSWSCCRWRCSRLWALARAAGKVLLIFVVAGVIALILNPAVAFLQRSRLPRGLAVLAVYLGFFLRWPGSAPARQPDLQSGPAFTHNLPHLVDEANRSIADAAGLS